MWPNSSERNWSFSMELYLLREPRWFKKKKIACSGCSGSGLGHHTYTALFYASVVLFVCPGFAAAPMPGLGVSWRAENASASSCSAHTAEARKQEVGIQSLPEAAFLTLLEAHNGSLQGTRVLFSLMVVTPTKPSLITSIKYVFNDILPLLSLSLPHSPALSASGSHRLCMTSLLLQTGRWKGERRWGSFLALVSRPLAIIKRKQTG